MRTMPYDTDDTFVEMNGGRYQWVAWHRGGHVTLQIGKRHLREPGSFRTLCGTAIGSGSTRVSPSAGVQGASAYWHTGDCSRCLNRAAVIEADRQRLARS